MFNRNVVEIVTLKTKYLHDLMLFKQVLNKFSKKWFTKYANQVFKMRLF